MPEVSDETLDRLLDEERWPEVRELCTQMLSGLIEDSDERHYWLAHLSNTYYEGRDYEKALGVVWRANLLSPTCPLVRWHLAGTLAALGDHGTATDHYRWVINRGVDDLADGPCGEGREWASGLVTDCTFRLACAYKALGRDADVLFRRARLRLAVGKVGVHTPEEVARAMAGELPAHLSQSRRRRGARSAGSA